MWEFHERLARKAGIAPTHAAARYARQVGSVLADAVPNGELEHQSSSHAAMTFCSSGIVRAMTCRLCTTAERLRSKRFLRTPL